MNRDDNSGTGGAGSGPTGGAGTGPTGGSGTGPGRTERKRQRPAPTGPRLALFLIVVGAIFAALLLGGCDDGTHQTCGETSVGTSASPSYEFACGVK